MTSNFLGIRRGILTAWLFIHLFTELKLRTNRFRLAQSYICTKPRIVNTDACFEAFVWHFTTKHELQANNVVGQLTTMVNYIVDV